MQFVFCSLKRRPPHSTNVLAYVKKFIRILAVSGRTLAIHGRFLPQKLQPRLQKRMWRNHKKSSRNKSKNAKIHQNRQKWRPSKKSSPQDRKWSGKGARSSELSDPPERLKSAKVGKKRVSKIDVFFDPLLELTFPHFRLPQAPKKQPKWVQNRPQDCQSSFLARMHILSALPMKYTHFAFSKSSKISQKQLKKHERHKLGKRKASEVDFWRFWGPQGKPKMHKNWKNAFQKSIEEKEAKKEARSPVRGQGRRRSRGQKECKIPAQEGFCLDFWQRVYPRQHSRRSAADLHAYSISADP